MIIDFREDRDTARRHDVLCARTGESLKDWPIFYADDEVGIVRCYLMDERGAFVRAADGNAAWEERRKAIKIVPKSPRELAEIDEADREFVVFQAELRTLVEVVDALKAESWRGGGSS